MAGNDKFRSDIKRFKNKSTNALDEFVRVVVLEMDRRIVMKSPVDTGRFRANFVIGNGFVNTKTSEDVDASGLAQIAGVKTELKSVKANGQTIYISNSLAYSYRLEYEGWSKQAPAGFIRTTIAEMNSVLNGAALEVKAKYF